MKYRKTSLCLGLILLFTVCAFLLLNYTWVGHYAWGTYYINHVNSYFDTGYAVSAIKEFKVVIRSRPHFAKAHYCLGIAYVCLKKDQQAIQEYQEAIRLKPSYAAPHYQLGLLYLRRNICQQAILEMDTAVRLNPKISGNPNYHRHLGDVYYKAKDYRSAIREFKAACQLNPKDDIVHAYLCAAYMKSKQYQIAITEYNRFIKIVNCEWPTADYNLGYCYAMIGNKEMAIKQGKILKKKSMVDPITYYDLVRKYNKSVLPLVR